MAAQNHLPAVDAMRDLSVKENKKPTRSQPTRLIIVVAVVLGLAILGTAIFNTTTLLRLRKSYLSNRGHEIAAVLDGQARGLGRRNNPIFWQSLLEANYNTYAGSVVFLALVNQSDNVLAYKGSSVQVPKFAQKSTRDVYVFEESLGHPRNPRNDVTGWRLQIGLLSSDTDFIRRQAFLQLAISGLAVIALVVLSVSLVRMLNRFLEMKMREGAEAQLKSLGIMAASLAHEIRNPLGAIKGLTQLAQEDLPPDHATQSQLQTVVNEAARLERLVSDLLDFAHAKEPQISQFELSELFSNLKTMLESKLQISNVALRLPSDMTPMQVRSDPAGLRQILLNVLMNAIDATPEGGTVELTARRDESDKSIVIQVEDSGKGLGQNNPDELFQPFVTTKVRGTGLGLAISKQIAEKLGGTVKLESLPGGGARCSIALPIL
jgi:signal transduction histidine kinase